MPRRIENVLGIDGVVEHQAWPEFDRVWPDLAKMIAEDARVEVLFIGECYRTWALKDRVARVSRAEANRALDVFLEALQTFKSHPTVAHWMNIDALADALPDRTGASVSAAKTMMKHGMRGTVPNGGELDHLWIVAARSRETGRGPLPLDQTLILTISMLADVWESRMGLRATYSSVRKLYPSGPPRSKFGVFVLTFMKAHEPNISVTTVATAMRVALKGRRRPEQTS